MFIIKYLEMNELELTICLPITVINPHPIETLTIVSVKDCICIDTDS